MKNKNNVIITRGKDIIKRTKEALKKLDPKLPPKGSKILIKPNLVEPMPPDSGAITRPEVIEGIIQFLGDKNYKIIIGESSATWETEKAFRLAGYKDLKKKYKIKLINFDKGKFIKIKTGKSIWPSFEIAKTCRDVSYIISAAPLKEHAFGVTLTIKNMMGVLKPKGPTPNKKYIHKEGDIKIWTKRMKILLNYIKPDLALIDGTTAMIGSHIHGRLKKKNITIVGQDALAVDMAGAKILNHKRVFYLSKLMLK